MRHIATFIVEVESSAGSTWKYLEEGYTAQEAVDKVCAYKDESERILTVYKQVENWAER